MKTNLKRVLAAVVASATVAAAVPAVANGQEDTYKAFGIDSGVKHGDGGAINFLRAVPSSTADSATTAPVDESELVYCFNENWEFPKDWDRFHNDRANAEYTKLSNVTGDQFYNLANQDSELSGSRNQAPRLQGEELKAKVLKIVYNGYDNTKSDRAGLQAALGLSDAEFYWATQRAIWYFTENSTFSVSGAERQLSPEGYKAFQILIGSSDAPEVPDVELQDVASRTDSASLNLFENTNLTNADGKSGSTGSYKPYQHLLSAQFVDDSGNPIVETPAPSTSEQPTPTTSTDTETETATPVTVTETVTPTTTVTETKPTTSVVTETTGVTTTTVQTDTETATSTVTTTVPGATVTESTKEPDTTTTLTEPGKEVTETTKADDVTTTETQPGDVVTETTKADNVTTTETQPGDVITETTKEKDVTTTETQPAATVTETAPQKTVTETTTPAEATVTTTVPVVTEVENAPYIGTKATDKADGDKKLEANGGEIVDTIDYIGLKPGEEYTMKGELMEKDKDGNVTPTGIVAETTFTPEESEGSVDVEFTVPEGYEGKTLVVFEELEKDGEVVADHKKPESVSQTVVIGERTPLIGTIAHEKDSDESDKIIDNGKVIDKVEYTNFIPGKEYTIKGELINYRDGKPSGIKAEKTFTPEEANGVVELEFEIPEGYGTEVLVAFETAYDADGNKVADHVDLNDGAQTIATGTDKPGKGHKDPKKLLGLIPLALIPFIGGGSSEGSSNGSSHGSSSNGGNEAPKGEAPKGEAPQNSEAQQGEQAEQTEAQPSRGLLASTGANVWMLVLVGIVLLGIGGALAFRGRRES